MLDENRIKLMTRMASYEDTEGKKTIPIASYFRGDYISFNVVKSIIGATVAYILVVGVYIYYNMETLIADVYKFDFMELGRKLATWYGIVVAIYAFFAYVIYSVRYDRAKRSLHGYYQALRKVSSMYEDEETD